MASNIKPPLKARLGKAALTTAKSTGKVLAKGTVAGGALAYGVGKTAASNVTNSLIGATGMGVAGQTLTNSKQGYNFVMRPFRTKAQAARASARVKGGAGGVGGIDGVIDLLTDISSSNEAISKNTSSQLDFMNSVQAPWMTATSAVLGGMLQVLQQMTTDSFRSRENSIEAGNQTPSAATSNQPNVKSGLGGISAAIGAAAGAMAGAGLASNDNSPGAQISSIIDQVTDGAKMGAGIAIGESVIAGLRSKLALKAAGIAGVIVTAAIDGVATAVNAEKWDTRTVSAAVGGAIAGQDQSWQSMISNTLKGGAAGMFVGSFVPIPIVGTLAGGIIGATLGAVANAIGPEKIAKWSDEAITTFGGVADMVFGTKFILDPVKLKTHNDETQAKIDSATNDLITTNDQLAKKHSELLAAEKSGNQLVIDSLNQQITILENRKNTQQSDMNTLKSELTQGIANYERSQTDYIKGVRQFWGDLSNFLAGKKMGSDFDMINNLELDRRSAELKNTQTINRGAKGDKQETQKDRDQRAAMDQLRAGLANRQSPDQVQSKQWSPRQGEDLILPFQGRTPVTRMPVGPPVLPDHLRGSANVGSIYGSQPIGPRYKTNREDLVLPFWGTNPVNAQQLHNPVLPDHLRGGGEGGMFRNDPIGRGYKMNREDLILPFQGTTPVDRRDLPPIMSPEYLRGPVPGTFGSQPIGKRVRPTLPDHLRGPAPGQFGSQPIRNPDVKVVPGSAINDRFNTPGMFDTTTMPVYTRMLQQEMARRGWGEAPKTPPVIINKGGDTTINNVQSGGSATPTVTPYDARTPTSPYEKPSVYGDRFSIFDIIP